MSNFQIKGKLVGEKDVLRRLAFAPENYRRKLFSWLIKERDSFVGNKSKDGVFRKKLQRKTSKKGRNWPKRVTSNFRGFISGEQSISTLKLKMGVSQKKIKFLEGLRLLGSGGVVTSSTFMPVPIWKNLEKIGVNSSAHNFFKQMAKGNNFDFVRKGGKIFYFDSQESAGSTGGLLFVGVKRIKVKKQFDFEGDWDRRIPKVLNRGQKSVDRATKEVDKGRVK